MKRYLNILVALLVLDLIGLGGFWFGHSVLIAKKDEVVQLRKEIIDEQQKAKQLVALRRTLEQAEKERAALQAYFYDSGEESQISFVSQMEALGVRTSGAAVETKSLDLITGTRPSFHGEFVLSGTWQEVYHFLRLVEAFPARIIIDRFTLSLGETTKSSAAQTWKGGMSVDLMSIKS